MKTKVVTTDEKNIEAFLNDGWEIMASSPNPYPQPYIYFFVRKDFLPEKMPTEEEIEKLQCNY